MSEFFLVILLQRISPNQNFSQEQKEFNFVVNSTFLSKITLEACLLHGLCYRLNADEFIKLCVGLTSSHVLWHSLRDGDIDWPVGYTNRLYASGSETAAKRNASQVKYKAEQFRNLDAQFYVASGTESE